MHKKKNYKIFRVYLTSYMILAFLPMLCIFGLYYNSFTHNLNETMLEKASSDTYNAMMPLETHLSILNNIPTQLYQNDAVRDYSKNGDTLSRMAVIRELRCAIGGNDLIDDIYVYFRPYETFVSAYSNSWNKQSVLSSKKNKILYFDKMDYDELFELLENGSRHRVLPAMQVQYGYQSSGRAMSFVQTLPPDNSFAPAIALILVDANRLERMLNASDEDEYMLFDSTGTLVLSSRVLSSNAEEALFQIEEAEGSGAHSIFTLDNTMVMSWVQSETQGFTLARFTSMEDTLHQLRQVRLQLLVLFLSLTLFTTALIVWFMRKTYRPVNNLVTIAEHVYDATGKERVTAFDMIEDALLSLQIENTQLSTRIKNQNPIMAEYATRTLLSTPEAQWNQQAYEEGLEMGLNLGCVCYQVLVLHYEQAQAMRQSLSVIVECCRNIYVASLAELGEERIVLVLGGPKEGRPLYERVNLAVLEAKYIGVGPQIDSVRRWNESYIRAALTCNSMCSEKVCLQLMRYEDLPPEAYVLGDYPWMLMQSFAAAVSQKNTNMVREFGSQVMELLCAHTYGTLEKRQMIFSQAIALFKYSLPAYREQIEEYTKRLSLHDNALDAPEMSKLLAEILSAYCTQADAQRRGKEDSPVYRSLGFISDEIGSPQLSLAIVSERVGLSVSRYSALFHKEMDCNFKEYVDALRMSRAKQLLSETNLHIADVGLQVGYANAYSFSRLFKKHNGMAPNEYRADHRAQYENESNRQV